MSKWTYLKALWRLSRENRPPRLDAFNKEERAQLSRFLKGTSAGAKLAETLRVGVMDANASCASARTCDEALRLSGLAAGYTSAVATIDALSGADSLSEEEAGDGPELNTDLDWMYNPKPQTQP